MATFNDIDTPDDERDSWTGPGLPPGVQPLLRGLVGFALAIALPYAVAIAVGAGDTRVGDDDDAERGPVDVVTDARAWLPTDAMPFEGHFQLDGNGPAVAEAGGSAASSKAAVVAGVSTELGADLDGGDEPVAFVVDPPTPTVPGAASQVEDVAPAASAGSAGGDEAPSQPAAPSEPATPEGSKTLPATPEGTAPEAAAPVEPAAPKEAAKPTPPPKPVDPLLAVRVPASVYEGIGVSIEDSQGAMGAFYAALGRTALKNDGALTTITHWGDSAIAADGMPSAARRLLQRQFGDGGHGWSLVSAGNEWYKRKDVAFKTRGWRAAPYIKKGQKDGRYGYGGAIARGYRGAGAEWETVGDGPVGKSVSSFAVFYQQTKKGGQLEVKVDGEVHDTIDMSGDKEDLVSRFEIGDGPHKIQIRSVGKYPALVYGVTLERKGPGVVYDGIGIIGARAARQLSVDEAHFHGQLRERAPDLMVLHYGGNAVSDKTPISKYEQTFRGVVRRFRQGRPEASCLVMTPIDHGQRRRGRVRTVPKQHKLMDVQRQVASEEGCAFFSLYDAMGGEGSIGQWYKASPKLASGDLAHPTAHGSKVLGKLFYKALMKGFAGYLDGRRAAAGQGGTP